MTGRMEESSPERVDPAVAMRPPVPRRLRQLSAAEQNNRQCKNGRVRRHMKTFSSFVTLHEIGRRVKYIEHKGRCSQWKEAVIEPGRVTDLTPPSQSADTVRPF
jgi:hypothetical protein